MNDKENDTIIALASPAGRGAVSIIRMSGSRAAEFLGAAFSCNKPTEHAVMRHGLLTMGNVSDSVMACVFYAPASYTGEDVAEIFCHGSPTVTERIISYFISLGARQAEGGEFTRRAFLNNKMSLDEAEAVCDLINAECDAQIRAAMSAMRGSVYNAVRAAASLITDVLASVEAAIDYPEEQLEEQTAEQAKVLLENAEKQLKTLASTFDDGSRVRSGIRIAIIGAPNAGKSSLLNALLGYDRAIVSDTAGTTRDTVEESYVYRGMLFTVVDTAGLREAEQAVEREGVRRSGAAAASAHLVLWMGDDTGFCPRPNHKCVLKVQNKTDLADGGDCDMRICALTGDGIDALKEEIYRRTAMLSVSGETLTNSRHYDAVCRAIRDLCRAISDLASPPEAYSVYLKSALCALGEITGETATEEVISRIFSTFCVGK